MSTRGGGPGEGHRVGPYRVVRRIGGGGMGVVLEAYDEALDRPVALKLIAPHLAEDAGFRARFTREARALACLDSAHVVRVYAHGEEGGRLYIATQLVPDGDLDQLIAERGALPVAVAVDLVAQVAEGLADAHGAGLVHRDIKPANVLLRRCDDGLRAYLSDFGVAREVGASRTRTAGTVGTPSYMAPELHTGGRAGVASDVYSLGCLLWAALTGRAPYDGTSDYAVASAHLEQPVPQLAGSSPLVVDVDRILRTAMAKDPSRRHASAAVLRDDLRRAQALPDTGRPGATSLGWRPLALPLVGVLLLVLLGGGIAYAVTRGGAGDPVAHDVPSRPVASTSAAAGELATATSSLARALEEQGAMTPPQARCTAERWIAEAGLLVLRDAGFFADDWTYVDQGKAAMGPAIAAAASTAAEACAGG